MLFAFHKSYKVKARIVKFSSLCAVFSILVSPSLVLAQSSDTIQRLNRMENEINTLSRAVYKGEKPPRTSFSSGFSSGDARQKANAEIQIQQMERELRTLTGQLEEKSYEIRQLKAKMERMSSDVNLRLEALERKNVGASSSYRAPLASAPSRGGPPARAPSRQNARSNAGQSLGTLTVPASPSASASASLGGGSALSGAGYGDQAAASYENAFALLKNSNYPAAEKGFQEFLTAYPTHVLAGNAKYWLGETFYVRKNYERAARLFAEGYQQYPKGTKAADNLLKLGMSLAGLGNIKDACVALGQLDKQDIAGSGPVLRRAKQEKTRLGC